MSFAASASLLAVAIVAGYALTLWWLLRHEPWLLLGCIALGALGLRVMYPSLYPATFSVVDEVDNMRWAIAALSNGDLAGTTMHHAPALLLILFGAVPEYWVPALPMPLLVRAAPALLGAASTLAAYTAMRALRSSREAAICAAILLACLPWSLYYGRVQLGGEIPFHELLLVTMLARLIWNPHAGWREGCCATALLTLLLYDYSAGIAALAFPVLAALVAHTLRVRGWCLGIVICAGLLWWMPGGLQSSQQTADIIAALLAYPQPYVGSSISLPMLHPSMLTDPWNTLLSRTWLALQIYTLPLAQCDRNGWTAPAYALHPWWFVGTAVLGLSNLASVRERTFLILAFTCALVPAVISNHSSISTHRMILALPIMVLMASLAVDSIPTVRWRTAMVAGMAVVVVPWSIRLFLSDAFWVCPS